MQGWSCLKQLAVSAVTEATVNAIQLDEKDLALTFDHKSAKIVWKIQ